MQPTIGRIVHYTISSQDAVAINRRRDDHTAYQRSHPSPAEPGQSGATGHQAHIGNVVAVGQVFPATVVRTFDDSQYVNLQVALDGNDSYWASSRREGTEPGTWCWPPRA